jgi:hypothetical protein
MVFAVFQPNCRSVLGVPQGLSINLLTGNRQLASLPNFAGTKVAVNKCGSQFSLRRSDGPDVLSSTKHLRVQGQAK